MDDDVYARLVSIKSDGSDGSCLPLFRNKQYHIGRDFKCDVKIADPTVLPYNCLIDYVELQGPRVTPAAATTILVNDKEIDKPVMLSDGDTIRLGNNLLRIDVRRILPTRDEDEPVPQPLLVDMITPPRVTKMTVRAKTQCRSLLSSTKPPVVAVSKKIDDSPAKRQLFADEHENENKKPVTRKGRSSRKTSSKKSASASKLKTSSSKRSAGKTIVDDEKVSAHDSGEGVPVRRCTRSGSRQLSETVVRRVRFSSRTKS